MKIGVRFCSLLSIDKTPWVWPTPRAPAQTASPPLGCARLPPSGPCRSWACPCAKLRELTLCQCFHYKMPLSPLHEYITQLLNCPQGCGLAHTAQSLPLDGGGRTPVRTTQVFTCTLPGSRAPPRDPKGSSTPPGATDPRALPTPPPSAQDTEDRSCSARGCQLRGKSQNPPTPDPQTQRHNWPPKEKQ